MEIEVTDVAIVDSDSIVISTDIGTEVATATSTITEVIPDSYVLTSLGIFTGNLDGTIPIWLLDAIDTALTTGDGNITSVLADMQGLIDGLAIGVNQNITQIESTNESLSALEESIVSRLNGNDASILNLETTRVTEDDAQTIALSVQQSTFGSDVEAFIGNIASTYVDGSSAIAQDIDLLTVSVNGVNASVSQISVVSVDEEEARAKHSLVVDVDGSIAGYVAETDGTTSEFTINADIFKVGNLTTNYTPLVVNVPEGRVEFNGYVSFTGLGLDSDSTSINGGLLETNTLHAETIIAGGTIAAPIINGGVITGGLLQGSIIEGAVIRASYLDLDGDLEILTDYHISIALYDSDPSRFIDAVYIAIDNEYRIPTLSDVRDIDTVSTSNVIGASIESTIFTYDTANVNSNKKARKLNPTIAVLNTSEVIKIHANGGSNCSTKNGNITIGFYLGDVQLFNIKATYHPSCDQGNDMQSAYITNNFGDNVSLGHTSLVNVFTSAGIQFSTDGVVALYDDYRDHTYSIYVDQGSYITEIGVNGETSLYKIVLEDEYHQTVNYHTAVISTDKDVVINNLLG